MNTKTYISFLSFVLLLLFCVYSCSSQDNRQQTQLWRQANGKIKILSTTAMIDDVVKRVGGNYVDSIALIKGELDPHSYQLVKGDDEKFASAHVIFYNGLGLEHGPSLAYHLHSSSKAISLGDKLFVESPSLFLSCNGQTDPHIWMDVSLWMQIVPYISEVLSLQDPGHRETFTKNASEIMAEMKQVHEQIRLQLQSIPEEKRYLVTSHDAFHYFVRAYLANEQEKEDHSWQKRFAAPEGLAPESQLSSTDIQALIDHLQKYRIEILFTESNLSKDSIRKIVDAGKEKGLKLDIAQKSLFGDAMGSPGSAGDTYLKMIKYNADTITKYLE